MRNLMPTRQMISTGLPKRDYEKLVAQAKAEGKSRSELVREFIRAGLLSSEKQ